MVKANPARAKSIPTKPDTGGSAATAPSEGVVVLSRRPLTAQEKRLPSWLTLSDFPPHIMDAIAQVYDAAVSEPVRHLLAMTRLGQGAVVGIIGVRRKGGWGTRHWSPETFVSNVVHALRGARDAVLSQTPQANIPIVNVRLDRYVHATQTVLDAFMSVPLDRIVCANPTCPRRGKHLLPGPWTAAMNLHHDATSDALSVVQFVEPSTARPDSQQVGGDQVQVLIEQAIEKALTGRVPVRSSALPPFMSRDFRTCTIGCNRHALRKAQAACVRALWTLSRGGKDWVAQDSVFALVARKKWAEIKIKRLDQVFRTGTSGGRTTYHALWDSVIRRDRDRPGYYQIVLP